MKERSKFKVVRRNTTKTIQTYKSGGKSPDRKPRMKLKDVQVTRTFRVPRD